MFYQSEKYYGCGGDGADNFFGDNIQALLEGRYLQEFAEADNFFPQNLDLKYTVEYKENF